MAKTMAKAYANAKTNIKKLKAGKLGRVAKLKRTAKELIGGKKTYLSAERIAGDKKLKAAKPKKKNVLKKYAQETGKTSYRGASGSDLKELQKRFGRK